MKGRKYLLNIPFTLPDNLFHIEEEDDHSGIFTRTVPEEEEDKKMRLTELSFERIRAATLTELFEMLEDAGVEDDERLRHSKDLQERLILMKKKMEGSSNTWKHLFRSVQEETTHKVDSLVNLMTTVKAVFQAGPTQSLSEILHKEGHLKTRNLLQEISDRMRNLKEMRSLVVVAGETNGGKSTFLNLLLGEDILPTDVLHCTFAICKIVYSDEYNIKTLDHNDQEEFFPCASKDEVKAILEGKVSRQEMKAREYESSIKEITVGMPADILKSGITLVDTPGIGENEAMDSVTMNFVRSTHASAFIYIIKSDTAGGVQEDRLLSLLSAIKERYSADVMMEAFDPRAAMFVCHRWDNIAEQQREKVQENALKKLGYVWPGFEPSQTYFFSTVDTMKHLPVDPEFVTDSYMTLLNGLKQLFDRASHNAIKHQYLWLKYMLQPACRHLRSMISHCILTNEELEQYFKSVADKQNKLMVSSSESSTKLQNELNKLSWEVKAMISRYLNFDNISPSTEISNWQDIIDACSKENFFVSQANRRELDDMILQSLLKLVDEHIRSQKIVDEVESKILVAIREHLGLFKCQIRQIKHEMLHGRSVHANTGSARNSLDVDDSVSKFGASTGSAVSAGSSSSSMEEFRESMTFDPSRLSMMVGQLLKKRRGGQHIHRGSSNSKYEIQQSVLGRIGDRIKHGVLRKPDPVIYVEKRTRKLSKKIRENAGILDSIVKDYMGWIQKCVTFAVTSIPKFIEVNVQLMEEIREHRSVFQSNKDSLVKVMEDLEPCRHHLKGYGLLYMNDINAETLAFSTERRTSTIFVPKHIVAECRHSTDSGFQGSICSDEIAKCLWAHMQGATIKIDDIANRVVIKTYTHNMDEKVILSEIASLRYLECASLAPFLGMTRIPVSGGESTSFGVPIERVSAFIFQGDLVSAHVYAKRRMLKHQQFIPEFVLSLLRGLSYIHRERLVHMELSLNTIMVDRLTGAVKLCHICKPREARLPESLNVVAKAWVSLSPNVLQGSVYEVTDDIYAFGLVLWELLVPTQPPYKEQRKWTLRQFIDECHPTNMLKGALSNLNISNNVHDVLEGTLLITRGSVCMSIPTIQSYLSDLHNEPAVIQLSQTMKRISTDSLPAPEVEITSPSGTGRKISFEFSNPETPLPKETASQSNNPNSPSPKMDQGSAQDVSHIKKGNKWSPGNPARRLSEPFVDHVDLTSKSTKHKIQPLKFLDKLRQFRSPKKFLLTEQQRSNSSDLHGNSFSDLHGDKKNSLGHNSCSPPQLRPKFLRNPRGLNSHGYHGSTPDLSCLTSHGSTPDLSRFNPQTPKLIRKDSIDVPKLMSEKFRTSVGRKLEIDDTSSLTPRLNSDPFMSGSMPSLLFLNKSTSSRTEELKAAHTSSSVIYLSHSSNPRTNVRNQMIPESRRSGVRSSPDTSWSLERKKFLGQGYTRSLQNLTGVSSDNMAQSAKPANTENIEEAYSRSAHWRAITASAHQIGSSLKRNSGYMIRPSPLATTSHNGVASATDSIGSLNSDTAPVCSSVQALSSSTSSQGADSGFSTDTSREGFKEIFRSFKDKKVIISEDLSAKLELFSNDVDKNNFDHSYAADRSKNLLMNGCSELGEISSKKLQLTKATKSKDTEIVERQASELSSSESFQLFADLKQKVDGSKDNLDSNNNSNSAPCPPPINFSELSFLSDSYDSD